MDGARGSVGRAIAAGAALVALAAGADQAAASQRASAAIVGGTRAEADAFPFIANLGGCTGSIIAPDRVLTAAHCVEHDAIQEGGFVKLAHGQVRRIARMAVAYDYKVLVDQGRDPSIPLPFDAAIVQLDSATDLPAIRLASAADAASYAPGTLVTTIGYGVIDEDGHGAGKLRFAQVQIRSDKDCRSMFRALGANAFVPLKMLCTTDPDKAKPYRSSCYGDSGGPLVSQAPDGSLVQVGTDGWGVACGFRHGDPEAYGLVPVIGEFALTPTPIWRPLALTRPRLTGFAGVGHVVTCHPPQYAPPRPAHPFYAFFANGQILGRSRWSPTLKVTKGLRHKRIDCEVGAESKGGASSSLPSLSKRVP
jgi:hypothetical protein